MLILTKFVNDVVPTISISKEKVSDIEIEQFEKITKRMEEMAREIHSKDFAWKEERRQFEQKRIEEAIENSKKMQELKEEIKQERLKLEQMSKEEAERGRKREIAKEVALGATSFAISQAITPNHRPGLPPSPRLHPRLPHGLLPRLPPRLLPRLPPGLLPRLPLRLPRFW